MSVQRFFPLILALLFSVGSFASAQIAPADKTVSIGPNISAKQYDAVRIGIPAFELKPGGSNGGLDPAFFQKVVYNDLEYFADCKRMDSQPLVEQTHRRDIAANQGKDFIDYVEWQRIGCAYVLKGEYSVDASGRLELECRLFNLTTGERSFGLKYSPLPLAQKRTMAHQISDDIIKSIFNQPGIASTQIVFVASAANPRMKELFVMDADGENLRQLTHDNSIAATPCWGMNGTEVYYTSYKDTNPDLWGIQIETRKTWVISRFAGLNYTPDWSPANKRIALTLGKDGNSEIYTMDRNGNLTTMKRLTKNACIDSSPCWNPTGTQMVFQSDRTGSPQVWAMDADGNNVHKLTAYGNYNDSPAWSPKGDRIAYTGRDADFHFNIYTMRIDGGDVQKVTSEQRNNEDPTFAPDGKHLVFSSNRTGNYEIFISDSFGKNVRQLTKMGGNAQSACWSPLFYTR